MFGDLRGSHPPLYLGPPIPDFLLLGARPFEGVLDSHSVSQASGVCPRGAVLKPRPAESLRHIVNAASTAAERGKES